MEGESWDQGRIKKKSALPVAARLGGQENLGEEEAEILGTHPPQKPPEMLQNELIKVTETETAYSDKSEMRLCPGAKGQRLWSVLPSLLFWVLYLGSSGTPLCNFYCARLSMESQASPKLGVDCQK